MKTGNVKHVAAFEHLLGFCNTHGAMYNPSKDEMKLTALNSLLTMAQQTYQAVRDAQITYVNAVNERQEAFEILPKLGTRILDHLRISDASPKLIIDVNNIRLRFRPVSGKSSGETGHTKANAGGINPPANAPRGPLSHLDYDSKITNLNAMISLISNEPLYNPNEEAFKVQSLISLHEKLSIKHKAVLQAKISLSNARKNRSKVLYGPEGIRDIGMKVKRYIRAVYGIGSAEYRQISSLTFAKR